ncbi:hypothetical protein JQX13_41050 [Archangium violaceum]|uniref:hypothetical protein n=1 Tax=Archangium violaceum TaxID=83451 RepID=UPI00193B7B58|nr:hypothetical protein [Archangium violaceum]QRK06428.1 hypothetical protein JQX13_41050 [Archangium violaceum]
MALVLMPPAERDNLFRSPMTLCTEPIHPTTLYYFRQNPMRAAEIESGAFNPLDDALRCVGICEKAVRESEQG